MNTTEDGICRTILATYHKIGTYNVFEHNFPAVMEVYESERDERGLLVQGSVHTPMGGGSTATPVRSSSGVHCPDCQEL